ncbi:TOTE conflict system archaeo-eukaryotic primase domain-containing protein [Vagococcus fluvialis]|uniref:TOTE conflict system archaeo-eukaryotic primase domain-containing protein n=1 Tax=Vagococcus fluvialis TaxID=2738 RepID=UPI003D0F793E
MGKNKEKITKREEQLLEQIKNLYIGYRKNYIKMYYNKGMAKAKYHRPTWALHDNQILAHIRQKETIGIFAGQVFSKFICFDVDSPELKLSKHTTKALVVLLNHDYNISLDDIHVSFSGKKGYHVEIFLDEFIESHKMEHFYYDVLSNLGKLSEKVEIEFRPLHTVGLKLPLSIHKETNKYCHFVDNQTLRKKTDSEKYFLSIEPMSKDYFEIEILPDSKKINQVQFLNEDEKIESKKIINNINYKIDIESETKAILLVLKDKHLLYPNSRHNFCFKASIFLKEQGHDIEDTMKILTEVLENTFKYYRDMIDKSTTLDYALKELKRIVKNTYDKNYIWGQTSKEIKIYKDELKEVLNISTNGKSLHLKKLALSTLIQSKRYASQNGVFYMPYSTMTKMGNTGSRGRLLQYLLNLEEMGFLEVVSRNEKSEGTYKKKANKYRVSIAQKDGEEFIVLDLNEISKYDLKDYIVELLTIEEAKEILTISQFYDLGLAKLYKMKKQ